MIHFSSMNQEEEKNYFVDCQKFKMADKINMAAKQKIIKITNSILSILHCYKNNKS
jgi:hypothetical protein